MYAFESKRLNVKMGSNLAVEKIKIIKITK